MENEQTEQVDLEKTELKNKKKGKITEILIMFIAVIIPYLASLIVRQLINVISLLSSILCPYFIIIAPSLMVLKLKKELKVSYFKQIIIKIYMVVFTSILAVSIVQNAIELYQGNDIIG